MPIATKCPGCKSLFRLADELAGKKVRCQKCAQLFAVPRPKSAAASAPPAPETPAPVPAAPPPPISLSLDEPPFVSAAPPAEAEVLDAILVEPPVLDAVLVDAPEPEKIIDATVAEEEEEAPAPRRRASKPSRPRRAADLPRHSTFRAVALALLAFTVAGVLLVACFVGIWAVISLDKKPANVAVQPPPPQVVDKGEFFHQLELNADGKANIVGNVPANSVTIYRVFLQQNQRYNILVSGILPGVRIQDGDQVIASREDGSNRVLLSFMPARTGEHTIRISRAGNLPNAGNFTLDFTRADPAPPTQIDLAGIPDFQTERSLRLQDPVSEDFAYGPCHKYLLNVKPGEKYRFKVKEIDFQPILRLQNGDMLIRQLMRAGVNDLDHSYTVPPWVDVVTVTVVSQGNAFGKYSLQVTRLSDEEKPGPRTVAFDFAGLYRRNETLTVKDPRDGELGHAKEYLIPMEKGFGYNIDMKSKQIDAHLTLLDPQGKRVAKDNDSGGDFNARMLFDPKEGGQYRLLASDVKQGTGAFTIDIARVKLPASMAVNTPVKTVKRQEADCDIVQADSGSFAVATTFAWAPDGKAFFILDRFGTLRRFRYPEFVEEQQLQTAPAQIHLTAEGLLVSVLGSAEMWLVDPQTLQLKRRLPRIGANVLAAPSLSHVYVNATFNKVGGGLAPGLIRHDLTNGETLSFPFMKAAQNTQFMAITPDGRRLLGSDGANHMVRWLVQDRKIIIEETGTRFFRGWPGTTPPLVVSADGKLLLHPIQNRFLPHDDIKPAPASDFGVAAYRVDDFKEPVLVLDTGIPFAAAAIDPKSGLMCMHTLTKGFVLADAQGKIVRELAISSNRGTKVNRPITRLVFHPDDGKLLAFFDTFVMSIELPKDLTGKIEEKEP